jgi:hypothetical protein
MLPTLEADSHESWARFQDAVSSICHGSAFVLRADVANYFETLPQHPLVHLLLGSGIRGEAVNLLEEILLSFRQRSSQGIIQGIYPSDVLGNFYLTDLDAECKLSDVPSARYIDDIFVGFRTETEARSFLVRLIEKLRQNGLSLNDTKTRVSPAAAVISEEREIDRYFEAARRELETASDDVFEGGYGFQGDWINESHLEDLEQGEDIELVATRALLDYEYEFPEQAEKIDRFCFPILASAGDEYGIERALAGLSERPHLTRIYFSYLSQFARSTGFVREE